MPGTDLPLVSVIIPYYNGRKYIKQAVQSVLDQTYKNIEIIVIDDASSDKRDSEYIEKLSRKTGFKLITHETNKGIARTLADAVSVSSGEYIAELSQDDLYKPEKIERQVKELTSKNLDAVYAAGNSMSMEDGQIRECTPAKTKRIIELSRAADVLKLQNLPCISIQGLLAKQSVFKRDIVPIWRDYLLDDWPVNIRLFEQYKVGFIDVPLWIKRQHTQQTSHNRWKWLGPQIEVIARMTPKHLKAEGIGNRLASMSRRLHKQNGDKNAIIRFAFAGLMLTESSDQHKKASRVLNKIPSKYRKAIIIPFARFLEDAIESKQKVNLSAKTENISWQDLGKKIAEVTVAFQGGERLNEIGKIFSSLAFNILSENPSSMDCAVKFALVALILMDDSREILQIVEMLRTIPLEHKQFIKEKCRFLRAKSNRSVRYLWLNTFIFKPYQSYTLL